MPSFQTEKKVHHSAQKMFDLVADIEKYPEFLPMCTGLTVHSRQERDGNSLLLADMSVGYKMIRETFTTQVHLRPNDKRIDVQYIDGPFKHLENRWTFIPLDDNGQNVSDNSDDLEAVNTDDAEANFCIIDFYIDYAFKNPLLATLMGSMFETAFRKFTKAFENRADIIYGNNE